MVKTEWLHGFNFELTAHAAIFQMLTDSEVQQHYVIISVNIINVQLILFFFLVTNIFSSGEILQLQ